MIRARMEELRRERARPPRADDFGIIRARMEDLRRGARRVVDRNKGSSGDPPEALSSCREYETEHEGRQLLLRRLNSPETLRIGPSIRSQATPGSGAALPSLLARPEKPRSLSGSGRGLTAVDDNMLRFFADRAAKKWPLRGSLKLG